jgi:mycofactocin system glycosyltransferase
MSSNFSTDRQWFRSKDGSKLLAGSPLTLFTVSETGQAILDAIESDAPLVTQHQQLTERLIATGAIHPKNIAPCSPDQITVVIPAFISDEEEQLSLQTLIDALRPLRVVIVDDASPFFFEIAKTTMVRLEENSGPAAARNTGLQHVESSFVVFVDTDVHISAQDVLNLAGHLADTQLMAVAPRVETERTKSFINEYESFHSPLDLGPDPAVVRPLSRVAYVPSAVLACNTLHLRQLEGFNEELRVGEDVDLVWRAVEAKYVVRYAPEIVALHSPRRTVRSMLKQRISYGSSSAALDKQHPRSSSPLRTHLFFFVPVMLLFLGYLISAAISLIPVFFYFALTLRNTGMSLLQRTQITWRGLASTARLTASAIRRVWWPLFAIASLVTTQPIITWSFCVLIPTLFALTKKKPRHPLSYLVVRSLDDMSYGIGVWRGAIQRKSLRCLLPVFTVRASSRR